MLRGVFSVTPGYAGGSTGSSQAVPTYEQVCTGKTGHAEVIKIDYEPAIIAYHDLLTVFFATHDPTTLNRQGNDVGTQYRSIILYTKESQKNEALQYISELNASTKEGTPIITEVKPLDHFYEAEEYHRDYYARNPNKGYCQAVISPKVQKAKKAFTTFLNSSML